MFYRFRPREPTLTLVAAASLVATSAAALTAPAAPPPVTNANSEAAGPQLEEVVITGSTTSGAAPQGENVYSYYARQIHSLAGSASNSTPVIADGLRLRGGGTQYLQVDPNIIPTSAIERVEVVADGDEEPPFYNGNTSGILGGSSGFNGFVSNPIGHIVSVGLRADF